MVVRVFVLILLFLSVFSYFIPINKNNNQDSISDIPLLIFKNSTMYTLNTQNMNRVVYSKEVRRFKYRDVMYEGAITIKNKDKNNNEITDVLYSDMIIKKKELYTFLKNVRFQRNDFITLKTNELFYDSKNKIIKNTLPFKGRYYNNILEGKNIYLDMNSYLMKASNAHFEIDMKNN